MCNISMSFHNVTVEHGILLCYLFIYFILIYPEKPLGTDSSLKVQSEQRAKAL